MINDDVETQIRNTIEQEIGNFTNDSAMMIAYERALETAKGPTKALIHDPFAKYLQGPKGKILSEDFGEQASVPFGFSGWPDFHRTWTVVRTKFIDDTIHDMQNDGIKLPQIVNLGAGLDTRPFRLKCYENFERCFDVDMEAINTIKEKVFHVIMEKDPSCKPLCKALENVSMDLLDTDKNLCCELSKIGFLKDCPSIFVAEGLIMYLGSGKERFLKEVSDSASPGSVFILNFMENADEETGRAMDSNYMSKNDLIKVLKDEGWDDTSIAINRFGDSKLSYGLYPTDRFDKTCFFSFLVCRKAR